MNKKVNKDINNEELNDVISLSKRLLKILYIVFIAILVLAGIVAIQKLSILKIFFEFISVIVPFFIGFVMAWLLRPLVLKLNKKINNNAFSSIIVFASFALIIFILFYAFIPTIYNEVNELVGLLPSFIEKITNGINCY